MWPGWSSPVKENPLFSEFDYLLDILAEHEVVASLGDGMRPGCLQDAGRHAKAVEYLNLGRLAHRALDAGVQRMIEGPGHIPFDQIGYNVRMIKESTNDAPLYLLGPLVTDIAPGTITSWQQSVAPKHVCTGLIFSAWSLQASTLPSRLWMILLKGPGWRGYRPISAILSGGRTGTGCHVSGRWLMRGGGLTGRNSSPSLFPDAAKTIHARDGELDTCSMCGDLCAVKMMQDIFGNMKKEM